MCHLCGLDDRPLRSTASSRRRRGFWNGEIRQWVIVNFLLSSDELSAYPVRPSTVSSIGKMWIRLPYLTSGHDWIETMSDKRTRKLFRTTRFMRIFSFGHVSSERTMQTVSFRLLPFNSTVSPRKSCNSSIFACERQTIELSSFVASSTRRRFGRSLRFKIAVAKSSFLFWVTKWKRRNKGDYSISQIASK